MRRAEASTPVTEPTVASREQQSRRTNLGGSRGGATPPASPSGCGLNISSIMLMITRAADTQIPEIILQHDEHGFSLAGSSDALRTLAAAVETTATVEISLADRPGGASVAFRRAEGPLLMTHDGPHAELCGGQAGLEEFSHVLRFVAAGPQTPSSILFHAHVEYYDGHPWIAVTSDAVVIELVG